MGTLDIAVGNVSSSLGSREELASLEPSDISVVSDIKSKQILEKEVWKA